MYRKTQDKGGNNLASLGSFSFEMTTILSNVLVNSDSELGLFHDYADYPKCYCFELKILVGKFEWFSRKSITQSYFEVYPNTLQLTCLGCCLYIIHLTNER